MAHIAITDKRAVYVNDHRVTDRSTKWGVHNTLHEFEENEFTVIMARLQEYKNSGVEIGEVDLTQLSVALKLK